MKIGGHDIDISNREKVFFTKPKLTKGDVIDYYAAMAGVMVPHMKHYGLSMHRFPDGIDGKKFFNKDAPEYFPGWITTVTVPKREGGSFDAPVADSKAALVYLADQAVLTAHLYLSRTGDLEHPDKMIFDLDPPGDSRKYGAVRQAALDLREVLDDLKLTAYVQTTGSKGFHVVVPLDRKASFDEVRGFATAVARVLVRRRPRRYTLEQRKDKRQGRVFLDTLRNAYGATAVAPYSIRALPGAPVAAPLDWDEVRAGASPRDWTMTNIGRRLKQRDDPWSDMLRHAQSIGSRRKKLDRLLDAEKKSD